MQVMSLLYFPHDYTPASDILNLANLGIRRKTLDTKCINSLVKSKIDAICIFNSHIKFAKD